MSEIENPKIEELLNSFIDGELAESEQNEVQRLISQDAHVAQRLRELQKTKMLVNSLPAAEAPARILHEIKTSLKIRARSAERAWSEKPSNKRAGARHLMARKVLSAAAMVGLIAILSGVIYTILAPEPDHSSVVPAVAFDGRLELKTDALRTVNTFIDRAIENNGLSDYVNLKRQDNGRMYSITCSREDLNLLLADLAGIWEKFDSSTLYVEAKPPSKQVVVDKVSAEQISKLITIPKPNLTSGDKTIEKQVSQPKSQKQVHLTILVAGSE